MSTGHRHSCDSKQESLKKGAPQLSADGSNSEIGDNNDGLEPS